MLVHVKFRREGILEQRVLVVEIKTAWELFSVALKVKPILTRDNKLLYLSCCKTISYFNYRRVDEIIWEEQQ